MKNPAYSPLISLCAIAALYLPCKATTAEHQVISKAELRDAIEGYWIGQLAGNYIGFPFENIYQEEPLPILIDRYYTWKDAEASGLQVNTSNKQDFADSGHVYNEEAGLQMNLTDRRSFVPIMADALGGSWSDDDNDFEFVYLHVVEKWGLNVGYDRLTEAWKTHINRFIWAANREARNLMDTGLMPPETGSREHNRYWYCISSQLTTEIWGVFHPGMPKTGGPKAQWVGKISTGDWGTHPDLFFGTLFSAAYFEKDVRKLVLLGRDALPSDSPFREGIDDLIRWQAEYPDWRDTRKQLHDKYYTEVAGFTIPAPMTSSMINGLAGVMALLYGENDWMQTVAIATTAGYDCDNQAATCGALLGMIHGAKAIPRRLTHEVPSRGAWSKPFNDAYINYSRDGLPNFTRNSDIIDRILAVAEQGIFLGGGQLIESDNGIEYRIPVR